MQPTDIDPQPYPTTPEHREQILAALAAVWARNPHQRLGQLIANLSRPQPDQVRFINERNSDWLDHLWSLKDHYLIDTEGTLL